MATDESNAGLATSLTDLMTSLMVLFILLLVASLNNAQQKGKETRDAILAELKKELDVSAKKGVEVKTDPKDPLALLVIVPEGLLEFALNDDKIPSGGIDFLDDFTPKLASTVCSSQFKREINSIVVEGHTDSSGTDVINLPLSQRRSMRVVQESLGILSSDDGQAPSHLRSCFLELISASGRGSAEPILNHSGGEDKPRSGRVVFRIRVRSLEQRQLREVLGYTAPSPISSTP